MMVNDLLSYIRGFLSTLRVKRLCRSYHVEPDDALGELYLRLYGPASQKQIRNPAAWISRNGFGVLQNWLRREGRTLV